jgi:excisionase family DNA binding protein
MSRIKEKVNSFEELPIVLTVDQVSSIMGISLVGAYELTRQKNFPAIRVGRRITIPKSSFIKWLEVQATGREE